MAVETPKTYRSRIVGAGSGFPERVMHNKDFEAFLDTNDEWIRARTGIVTRRIADQKKGESTLSYSLVAAKNAIEKAKIDPKEIDLIVVGTVTPESVMPTTANSIQAALGASHAFSFDLQAACSGFLYALGAADSFVRMGSVRNAVVVGAETLSSLTNWQDRGTCILFGDGAGAVVIQRTEDLNRCILTTRLYSDGTKASYLNIEHGYSHTPPYVAEYRRDKHSIHMTGGEIFKLAVRGMIDSTEQVLRENNLAVKDVDFFLFHQANIRIIEMCMKHLGIDSKKTWLNIDKYGNTSAATLPVCLDEAWRAGAVKEGDTIAMTTFGGGVTWGASVFRL